MEIGRYTIIGSHEILYEPELDPFHRHSRTLEEYHIMGHHVDVDVPVRSLNPWDMTTKRRYLPATSVDKET